MPNDLFASIVGAQESVKLGAKNAAAGASPPTKICWAGPVAPG
jgi:hypothetical protein